MNKNINEIRKEYIVSNRTNIELDIIMHDNGTNKLHICAYNNDSAIVMKDIKEFIREKLNNVLLENNIAIVGFDKSIISSTWRNVVFYIDNVDNIAEYKKALREVQIELIDNGTIELGNEFSNTTILQYQASRDKFNSIISEMLSKGYELGIQDSSIFLSEDDERMNELYNKEENRYE